jgi:hypothetical protein
MIPSLLDCGTYSREEVFPIIIWEASIENPTAVIFPNKIYNKIKKPIFSRTQFYG